MNEGFDLKLTILRMLRGWYKIVLATVLGALIIGIPYIVVNIILADDPDYRMRVTLHVEYAEDSAGNALDYINEYTWGEWVDTDIFIDEVNSKLEKEIDKSALREFIDATLETDGRLVEIDITSKDPTLTENITSAVAASTYIFVDHIMEISAAEVVKTDDYAEVVDRDIRVKNAFLLGAFLGFVFSIFAMLILFIVDDSVYIPLLLKERFAFPVKTDNEEEECMELLKGASKVTVGKKPQKLPGSFSNKCAVLEIESGAHNGRLLLDIIYELEERGITVKGAIIKNADMKLIKAYMASTAFPNPFIKE